MLTALQDLGGDPPHALGCDSETAGLFWIIVPTVEPEEKMRLKTWRRVGVVLSVVWLLVGGYWATAWDSTEGISR